MTRHVTNQVRFDCDFEGCPKFQQTEGPLPKSWGELSLNEMIKEEGVEAELWTTNNYHLCPDHIPKLKPE